MGGTGAGVATVFVDRDGVINRHRRRDVRAWEEFEFLPGAVEGLADLTRHGLRTVVVTNQSAVNRGVTPRAALEEIHRRMVETLAAGGARVEGVFYCPHRSDEGCDCRKPKPGLLFQAAKALGIDLARSYMVGDALWDVTAAKAAGCRPILVLTGLGRWQFASPPARGIGGFAVSRDLRSAVRRILVAEGLVEPSWVDRLKASTTAASLRR